jgi:hypothetical protein
MEEAVVAYLRYYAGICLESSKDSRSPGRDLNPGPLEARVLVTWPRRSVRTNKYF